MHHAQSTSCPRPGSRRSARRAFSLVECAAVTIAALILIALTFPVATHARAEQRRQVNLSNILTINAANGRYMADFRGRPPIFPMYTPRYDPARPGGYANISTPYATAWTFGGKNNNAYWATRFPAWDVEAADRPLNPYVTNAVIDAPPRPLRLPADSPLRTSLEIPAFRDPSDWISHMQNWPLSNAESTVNPNTLTTYDDVGTSYSWNKIPLDFLYNAGVPGGMSGQIDFMTRRIANHQNLSPRQFVWVADQWLDLVVYEDPRPAPSYINGYKDVNMSVMGFLDGSAAYKPVKRGLTRANLINREQRYQLTFDDFGTRKKNPINVQAPMIDP